MKPALMKTLGITAFAVLTLLILGLGWPGAASAQVQRYWCPDRVGAEIQAQPGPGCEPLVVEEDEIDKVRRLARPPLTLDNIEGAVETYFMDISTVPRVLYHRP